MPTTPIQRFTNDRLLPMYVGPDHPETNVALAPSIVYLKGTILGEITATPGTFAAYASGNVNGSETPKSILDRACATDAAGNITYGATPTGGVNGETHLTVPAFFGGAFKTSELVGLDANAATKLGGHLVNGTLADGIYSF